MSRVETDRSIEEDLLARAVDDWVTAAEVIDLVRRSGLTEPASLRDLAIGLISRLILAGLVVPGEYDGVCHRAWDIRPADAIARIIEDWSSRVDPFVMPGEIVWLDLTTEGQEAGERVLHSESPPSDPEDGE